LKKVATKGSDREGDVAMASRKPLILVVDDDRGLLKLVRRDLELEDYRVITASDGKTGLELIEDEDPALVLLDILMPGLDGFHVCERTRQFSDVPIIMLTAKSRIEDVVNGLDIGADDYVTKPFGADELLARVKAALRRTNFPEEMVQPAFTSGKLRIDFSQHRVTLGEEEVMLTPTEYRLLCLLACNAGRVLTHDQLLSEVWGWPYHGDAHVLQVAVNRLRKKIEDDPSNPKYIATKPGIGYMFKESTKQGVSAS